MGAASHVYLCQGGAWAANSGIKLRIGGESYPNGAADAEGSRSGRVERVRLGGSLGRGLGRSLLGVLLSCNQPHAHVSRAGPKQNKRHNCSASQEKERRATSRRAGGQAAGEPGTPECNQRAEQCLPILVRAGDC